MIRRGPLPPNGWSSNGGTSIPAVSAYSSETETRRNSSGFRGDSYRRGVRFLGLDRGRFDRASMATRSGEGPSRDDSACSASDRRSVRLGVTWGDDRRSASTLSRGAVVLGLWGASREFVSEFCPCMVGSFLIS